MNILTARVTVSARFLSERASGSSLSVALSISETVKTAAVLDYNGLYNVTKTTGESNSAWTFENRSVVQVGVTDTKRRSLLAPSLKKNKQRICYKVQGSIQNCRHALANYIIPNHFP